jgi:hypothetical protein
MPQSNDKGSTQKRVLLAKMLMVSRVETPKALILTMQVALLYEDQSVSWHVWDESHRAS